MKERVYGATGKVGVDGMLSPEQARKLDRLQHETVREAFAILRTRRPGDPFPLAEMATGIGKGKMIHIAIERLIRNNPDARVLLIAGTKNILADQSHKSLAGYRQEVAERFAEEQDDLDTEVDVDELLANRSFLYKTGKIGQRGVNVEIGTMQTVQSKEARGELHMAAYNLVIVDEVHNIGTPSRAATVKKSRQAIGFTATSQRHSGELKTPEDYGFKVFKSYPLPQAQRDELLPPLFGVQIDTKSVIDNIPTTRQGEIDYPALERLLKNSPQLRPYIVKRLIPIISSPDGKKYKTILAVNYIWEAVEIAQLLQERGINTGLAINRKDARDIHSFKLPAYREESLERYALPHTDRYAVQVLISPQVAGEGLDTPYSEILGWVSPTDSGLRYSQFNGRLARRHPGKAFGLIVDCLYQTDQYKWSYNMGRWMKGDVRQLDNGLLYLGSDSTIQTGERLSSQARTGDRVSLDTLVVDQVNLQPLQEGEVVLGPNELYTVFIGNKRRIYEVASRFHERHHSDVAYFAVRQVEGKDKPTIVLTASGKDTLIPILAGWGISVRKKETDTVHDTVPEGSISLAQSFRGELTKLFVGDIKAIVRQAAHACERLKREYPDEYDKYIITVRLPNRTSIMHVTPEGKEAFMDAMLSEGARVREKNIQPIQPEDFLISSQELAPLFKGNKGRIFTGAKSVILELRRAHPEWVVTREGKNKVIFFDALITEEAIAAFFSEMQKRGFKRK